MDSTLFELRNNSANQPRSKKSGLTQRPFSAQGPKLGQQRFVMKVNGYDDNEGGYEQYNNNTNITNNTNIANVSKSNRPGTGIKNKMYSKEDLINSKPNGINDPDNEIGLIPKELNTEKFVLQDIQKLIPKNTQIDKEKLYEETLQLKNTVNKLKDENLKLKTRNLTLERENAKLIKMLEKMGQPMINTGTPVQNNESSIVANLKRQNKDLREEIKIRMEEIENYKRNTKVTKYQDLESELKVFLDENVRLKSLLEAQLKSSSQIKPEDFQALEEKYYMQSNILDTLQKEMGQYKQAIKFLEEENQNFRRMKEIDDKNAKKQANEVNRLKKKLKEKEQEVHKLVTSAKYDMESLAKKNPLILNNIQKNTNTNQQGELENIKSLLKEKEKKIEELEGILKEHKKQDKEKEKHEEGSKSTIDHKYKELERAYQNLEQKYFAMIAENNRNESTKKRTSSPNTNNIQNEEYLGSVASTNTAHRTKNALILGSDSKLKKKKRIMYEDVQDIGYELTLILRLKQIPYDELQNKLFDEKNSRTQVSIEDLKIILLSDPFELNDMNNAYLAARFLFEYGDDKFDANDPNQMKELGYLKDNFKLLIGHYDLITEDSEKDLFDAIALSIMKHEENLKVHFDSLINENNQFINHQQLIATFKNLQIELNDEQLDYLILRLYDLSHSLYELDFIKIFEIFQTDDNARLKQIFEMYNENMNDLHQIKETDSDERERIRSARNRSSANNHQEKEADEAYEQEDEDYNDDDDEAAKKKARPQSSNKFSKENKKANPIENNEYDDEPKIQENNQSYNNKADYSQHLEDDIEGGEPVEEEEDMEYND